MQKIIGYHGTKERFAKLIIHEGFKISARKAGDNHWLGHGIYFYSDYELAEWWAKTKVDKHNKKYGNSDTPIVIKGGIEAENVWDLDSPFMLEKFKKCQLECEKYCEREGICLDFSTGKGNRNDRIRCFWMDTVKDEYEIDVIMYTFTRHNPSYINSKYHVNVEGEYLLNNMGLSYHEKQICVTNNCFIVDKDIVNENGKEFDEVIV